MRRSQDGDIIGLAPDDSGAPHLSIGVGGRCKSVRSSLAEMRQHPLPAGFMPIVARIVDSRRRLWRWHRDSDDAYDTLDALLAAVTH